MSFFCKTSCFVTESVGEISQNSCSMRCCFHVCDIFTPFTATFLIARSRLCDVIPHGESRRRPLESGVSDFVLLGGSSHLVSG